MKKLEVPKRHSACRRGFLAAACLMLAAMLSAGSTVVRASDTTGAAAENNQTAGASDTGDFLVAETADGTPVISGSFSYEIVTNADESQLPSGYTKTKLILYGVSVPAYTLTSDQNSDYFLIYCRNSAGEEGFYQYDRTEKTMQRYTGSIKTAAKQGYEISLLTVDQYNERVILLSAITAAACALTALCAIVIIRQQLKLRKEDDSFY